MNILTLLLEIQSQPTPILLIPPSKQLALGEIPCTAFTGLQKNTKNIELCKTTQTQPSHLPQCFNIYPITMTPCKPTCTPSKN